MLGRLGGFKRADHDGPQRDGFGVQRLRQQIILVHHARQQRRIERSPIHADAHRAVIFDRRLNHDAEIIVVFLSDIDVSGINAVFGQRPRHLGIFLQQEVAVVVEIADHRHAAAELVQRLDNLGDRARRLVGIHRHAHQLGAGIGQRHHLIHGGRRVGGVGIGHGLNHDRVPPAHHHRTNTDRHGTAARTGCHRISS